MPEFIVEIPETKYRRYYIEADDKEQAASQVNKGGGAPLRCLRTPRDPGEDSPGVYGVADRSRLFDQDRKEAAKETAQQLAQWANDMGADIEGLIEELHREHRTIQQKITSVFLHWLYSLAELKEGEEYDLRNEAAVKAARKVKEALGYYGDRLPFI